jgi:hypothetical protein
MIWAKHVSLWRDALAEKEQRDWLKETIFKENRMREEDSRGQGKKDQWKVERKKLKRWVHIGLLMIMEVVIYKAWNQWR